MLDIYSLPNSRASLGFACMTAKIFDDLDATTYDSWIKCGLSGEMTNLVRTPTGSSTTLPDVRIVAGERSLPLRSYHVLEADITQSQHHRRPSEFRVPILQHLRLAVLLSRLYPQINPTLDLLPVWRHRHLLRLQIGAPLSQSPRLHFLHQQLSRCS